MFYLKGERPVGPARFEGGRLRGEIVLDYNSPALRCVLADPLAFTHSDAVTVLKDNARSRVVHGRIDGRDVVVKQSHAKTASKAFKRAFLPSRAARGWYAAHTVEAFGVPTASAIAYVDARHGPFRGRSWLISEWVSGQDARTCLTAPDIDPGERTRLIKAIVDIYARLHRARITHGDNRPENFMIHEGRPVLIDLDVTVRHPPWSLVFRRYARRDVRQLVERWHKELSIAEEFRRAFRDYGLEGA
ncbi:lipopolysaccharide kinase InaA family protein [Halofilum ochraceum]|uniref:lipopolysaccharide kinase InaA family protein n=1 Tax=Halofilum ochraceum TaxID=1611323 RepID=UPI000833EBAC|nr:lipopolysaccharide kinase InaA family protein [Halofilum ochraceum]